MNKHLARCQELAQQAAAKGNPPVGAVIIRGGQIVGEGAEAAKSKRDVTCHAEIEALRDAVKNLDTVDLSDCILMSTHEPCVMCSYAIRYHKIKEVHYLNAVESVGGINSIHPILTDEHFWPKFPPPKVKAIE